jgi:nicotinamide-nucleotide amidase
MFSKELLKQTQILFNLSKKSNIKIVSAESCTGGLVSTLITEIPGSSQIFDRGFVTYSNLAKNQNLSVKNSTLKKFGAVSKEVASQMAVGAVKNSEASLSIATTGIAGPKSQNEKTIKPIGLVYISSFNSLNDSLIVEKFNFSGDRNEVRLLTLKNSIEILINQINNTSYD